MSSNVKNFGNLVLDVRNERDDFNVKSKPIIEDVNEKLISSEMGININSLSKSRNESFTITSSMDTEKDKTKDGNKKINKELSYKSIVSGSKNHS